MKFILDSNATSNHFNNLILGTTDSVKDHNGKEMKTSIIGSVPTSNMTTSSGTTTTTIRPGLPSPSFPPSPPTTSNTPPPPAAKLPP